MVMVGLYYFCHLKCFQEQNGNIFTCSVRIQYLQNRTFFGAERSVLIELLDPLFPRTLRQIIHIDITYKYFRTSYSSVLTIVAFSVERYLAICHPLYSYTMSGLRRASKIIAVVWILALTAAIPFAIFTKVHYVTNPYTNQVEFL